MRCAICVKILKHVIWERTNENTIIFYAYFIYFSSLLTTLLSLSLSLLFHSTSISPKTTTRRRRSSCQDRIPPHELFREPDLTQASKTKTTIARRRSCAPRTESDRRVWAASELGTPMSRIEASGLVWGEAFGAWEMGKMNKCQRSKPLEIAKKTASFRERFTNSSGSTNPWQGFEFLSWENLDLCLCLCFGVFV